MGIIKNGKYYPDDSPSSSPPKRLSNIDNINQQQNLQEQARDHAHDIIQPYTADGQPNPDFIDYYPEQSKEYGFIKDKGESNE